MKNLTLLIIIAIFGIMILQGSAEAGNCILKSEYYQHKWRQWCETDQCPNPCEGRVRIIDGKSYFYCYCPE